MREVKVKNEATMTPNRREMFHHVMDNHPDLTGTMYILHGYKYCDTFLLWLYENRYTGKNLVDWLIKNFNGSVPKMVEFIVKQVNKTAERIPGRPDFHI